MGKWTAPIALLATISFHSGGLNAHTIPFPSAAAQLARACASGTVWTLGAGVSLAEVGGVLALAFTAGGVVVLENPHVIEPVRPWVERYVPVDEVLRGIRYSVCANPNPVVQMWGKHLILVQRRYDASTRVLHSEATPDSVKTTGPVSLTGAYERIKESLESPSGESKDRTIANGLLGDPASVAAVDAAARVAGRHAEVLWKTLKANAARRREVENARLRENKAVNMTPLTNELGEGDTAEGRATLKDALEGDPMAVSRVDEVARRVEPMDSAVEWFSVLRPGIKIKPRGTN